MMRPTVGLSSYRTPVKGLYLCGSGAHPGAYFTILSYVIGYQPGNQSLLVAKKISYRHRILTQL